MILPGLERAEGRDRLPGAEGLWQPTIAAKHVPVKATTGRLVIRNAPATGFHLCKGSGL